VADIVFEADGSPATSDLYRARVRNHGQLAYRGVAAWLDGEGAAPPRVLETLVSTTTSASRTVSRSGSWNVGTTTARSAGDAEPKAVFDGDSLSDLDAGQKNRAMQLIEDFMIAANA